MRWILFLHILKTASAAAAVLGIDLGTDFVKASLVAPNAPFEIVLTPDSQRKDASGLVVKPKDGERIYGSAGASWLSKFPASSFYAVKPLLGVPFDDLRVALFKETHPGLQIVRTSRNSVAFNVSGSILPIEEIVAMQLGDVVGRGTQMVREKTSSKRAQLKQVAISVPNGFGSLQRQALVDSSELANLDLVNLVSDAVAVAINYANSPAVSSKLTPDTNNRIIVYDVGASVGSATLVNLQQSSANDQVVNVEVEGSASSAVLSGRALTTLIREIILNKFTEKFGEVTRTARLLNRLWREAERAKQVLSANAEVHIHIESLADDNDLDCKISREEFESLAKPQADLVLSTLQDALGSRKLDDVSAVVLVGGAIRTPFILDALTAEVGEPKLSKSVNADEANVQGTAMRGINLSGVYRSKRIFNVTDASAYEYSLILSTSKGPSESLIVFEEGASLNSTAQVYLPLDTNKVILHEGRKKLITWELPYLKQNLQSLHEPGPYTCVSSAQLRASFVLDNNGIVSLKAIEAVCNSTKVDNSTKTNATASASASKTRANEDVSSIENVEKESTSELQKNATQVEGATQTQNVADSTTSTKTSAPVKSNYLKTRRVAVQSKWEQAPLNSSERADLRAHLKALDQKDADRKEQSVVYHELESLAYKIRGLGDDLTSDLRELAERMISHVENNDGEISELKSLLSDARSRFNAIIHPEVASESTTVEKSSTLDSIATGISEESTERTEPTESINSTVETATESPVNLDPEHNEL